MNFDTKNIYSAILRLQPFVQHYSWGVKGILSQVAQLARYNSINNLEYLVRVKKLDVQKHGETISSSDGINSDEGEEYQEFEQNRLVKVLEKERSEPLELKGKWQDYSSILENQFYAEWWIGNHKNGVAAILVPDFQWPISGQLTTSIFNFVGLDEYIEKKDLFLPFLLKILSIYKPLSIQSHPDKSFAKRIHDKFPGVFSDTNHKPEMCIALSKYFYLFCGFKSIRSINVIIANIPEMNELLGDKFICDNKAYLDTSNILDDIGMEKQTMLLKNLMKRIFLQEEILKRKILSKFVDRISKKYSFLNNIGNNPQIYLSYIDEALQDINNKCESIISSEIRLAEIVTYYLHCFFPGDTGIFVCLFMRLLRMEKGEACFISPNVLHSYVYAGDCVECMANSDNVLRCGLTDKKIEIHLLLESIQYSSLGSQLVNFTNFYDAQTGEKCNFVSKFACRNVCEFILLEVLLPANNEINVCFSMKGICMCIVLEGSSFVSTMHGSTIPCEELKKGDALLVQPSVTLLLRNKNSHTNFFMYVATTPD